MMDTPVSETADLRTENDRLRAENDRLRAENDRLRAENDRLRTDDMLVGLDPIVALYLSRTGFDGLDQK